MSMIGNLVRLPEEVRIALHENPEAIEGVIYPEFDEPAPPKQPGFIARLLGKKPAAAPPPPPEPLHQLGDEDAIDIDKTWHGVHFLLTGSDWEGDFPAGFLVSCGEPVGDVDLGYGPAKSFTPDQVKAIASYLNGLDREALKGRFDPAEMDQKEIYPGNFGDAADSEEEWGYLEGGLDQVTAFVSAAAEENLALLVFIN